MGLNVQVNIICNSNFAIFFIKYIKYIIKS